MSSAYPRYVPRTLRSEQGGFSGAHAESQADGVYAAIDGCSVKARPFTKADEAKASLRGSRSRLKKSL